MPRHTRPKRKTRRAVLKPLEVRDMTTEQMARSLVNRGLASELILGNSFRSTTQEGTTTP